MIITEITDKDGSDLTDNDYDTIIEIIGKALADSSYAGQVEVGGYE